MKSNKHDGHQGVQELCRKLKLQLDELAVNLALEEAPDEEKNRRIKLLEQLKQQLGELSQ